MVFSSIGIFSIKNAPFAPYMIAIFGLVGFMVRILGYGPAPTIGENLRRALVISRGTPMVFIERPISLGFIIKTVLILILMSLPPFKKARQNITCRCHVTG